ncbi:MAG: aminodeoxychorismate/anthranilate synthase component II [Pseudobdellovibrio sp.]
MNALLIDHDDSFTFNLLHWLRGLTDSVEIINHSKIRDQNFSNFDFIVLSPGPKNPQDYPNIINWLNTINPHKPIFGVCLGMQLMTIASNGSVTSYAPPRHGKKSVLNSENPVLNKIAVARYHSLKCMGLDQFKILATSDDIPMLIQHQEKKWLGIQFHPESFLTEKTYLFQNFLNNWICT